MDFQNQRIEHLLIVENTTEGSTANEIYYHLWTSGQRVLIQFCFGFLMAKDKYKLL